jgi:uncharacterized damage-inducible protein DinB
MPSSKSPISVDTARKLNAYNAAAFTKFWRAAHRLPWRVASARRETGHQSIFGTLTHILNVHEVWISYIVQGRTREVSQLFTAAYRRPTNWPELDAYSKKVWSELEAYYSKLTPQTLSRRAKAPWMPGSYTVGDAVLQTTFEQAHHLGEIIALYWQRDTEPPQMMWIPLTRARM